MGENEKKELLRLREKEEKAKIYNKEYYKGWKENYDRMKEFYKKWNGKEIKGVKLV